MLTANEAAVLHHLINNEYGEDPGDATWLFVCERSGLKGLSLNAVFGSLVKKGLAGTNGESVWATPEGLKANSLKEVTK